MTDIRPVPEATGFVPKTPKEFKTYATVGAMLALFGAGDTLARAGMLNDRLYQKMGKQRLQRIYSEVDKMNRFLENMWETRHADQMSFLASDITVVLMVLTSVDLESRTGLTSEFRRVWARLLEAVGDEDAMANMELELTRIRKERGLQPIEADGKAMDEVSFLGEDGKVTIVMPHAEELKPNCAIFVRDVATKAILPLAQVQVAWDDEVKDRFDYDSDILYERQYTTGKVVTFAAKAPGYAAGGCEKMFYEGDEEQLMVNIWLTSLSELPNVETPVVAD